MNVSVTTKATTLQHLRSRRLQHLILHRWGVGLFTVGFIGCVIVFLPFFIVLYSGKFRLWAGQGWTKKWYWRLKVDFLKCENFSAKKVILEDFWCEILP